jgi:phosphate transport system ATP-binding protein
MNDSDYIRFENVSVYYDRFRAVRDLDLSLPRNAVTALIGPSGCGKSTILRCLNRMNELSPRFRLEGKIYYDGIDIYKREIDPTSLRRRVGMVFQKPNPYPTSIYDNIAWGARINGVRKGLRELVEETLKQVALWDDVKDRLKDNALTLSGGQQQRLCIARTISLKPDIVLMDEPTSALDPVTAAQIEDLIAALREEYTILLASHNLNQAARISDYTAFFMLDEQKCGYLEEFADSPTIFLRSDNAQLRDYILGRYWDWSHHDAITEKT